MVRSSFQTNDQPGTFKCARSRCKTCPFIHNVGTQGETWRRLGDRFREHRRDVEGNDKDASEPVAVHFNLPNHSKQHVAVCGLFRHPGSSESRKALEQNLIFHLRKEWQKSYWILQPIAHISKIQQTSRTSQKKKASERSDTRFNACYELMHKYTTSWGHKHSMHSNENCYSDAPPPPQAFARESTYSFQFKEQKYLRTHGTAMVTKKAVTFANIFIVKIETQIFD